MAGGRDEGKHGDIQLRALTIADSASGAEAPDGGDVPADMQSVPTDSKASMSPVVADSERLVETDGGDVENPHRSATGSGTGGIFRTSFNFTNTIIGSGLIGLPFAMQEAGLPLGLIELLLFAVMTDYSVHLLIQAGIQAKSDDYQDVCRKAFGNTGYVLSSVFLIGGAFGACVSYSIIIGDTIPTTFAAFLGTGSFFAQRTWMIMIPMLIIMLPVSLMRRLEGLSHTSVFSMLCVLFILLVVLIQGQIQQASPEAVVPPPDAWAFARSRFLQATGVISFTYVCQHSAFLMYRSLRDNTQRRWRITAALSVYSSAAICVVMAVAGYVAYYDQSRGNILNSFPIHVPVVIAARLAFAVTMFFTFPLECFVVRHVIEELYRFVRARRGLPAPAFWWPRHILITLGIVLAAMLVGTTNAVALSLVLPALVYLRLMPGRVTQLHKIPALVMCIFGIVDGIIATVLIVVGFAQAHTSS